MIRAVYSQPSFVRAAAPIPPRVTQEQNAAFRALLRNVMSSTSASFNRTPDTAGRMLLPAAPASLPQPQSGRSTASHAGAISATLGRVVNQRAHAATAPALQRQHSDPSPTPHGDESLHNIASIRARWQSGAMFGTPASRSPQEVLQHIKDEIAAAKR